MKLTEKAEQVRDANWALMIQDRLASGLGIREWCQNNNVTVNQYYYHLRKLRRMELEKQLPDGAASQTPVSVPAVKPNDNAPAVFAEVPEQITVSPEKPAVGTALRITSGNTVIEVSNDASTGILSLLREVLLHAS